MERFIDAEELDLRAEIVAILPRLRRFCMALAKGQDAGDDLCQEAVTRALSRAELFTPGTRVDSWMYRIAQNIHIDRGRRMKTRGVEVDVDEAFALSGDDGRAVVEGQSYRDAAEFLGIPIGTVMSRIARARKFIDAAVNGPAQGDNHG